MAMGLNDDDANDEALPTAREARVMAASFVRAMLLPLWRARRFALLPPDLLFAPLRLCTRHRLLYEATFRPHLRLSSTRAQPRPPDSAGAGWAAGEPVDAALLGELYGAMVHARAAFGLAAATGQLETLGRGLMLYALHGGYARTPASEHTAALCTLAAIAPEDVRLAQWASSEHLPAHYVCVDRARGWIVVSIRGTHSARDLITCVHAAAHPFKLRDPANADAAPPRRLNGNVHAGMLASARRVLRSVGPTVRALAEEFPALTVVVVGQSLGAGTASLVCALMRDPLADVAAALGAPERRPARRSLDESASRPLAPRARCFALSPPAMADLATARALGLFVTSAIVGADVVPRACAANVLQLVTELEDESRYPSAYARAALAAVSLADLVELAQSRVRCALGPRAVRALHCALWGGSVPGAEPVALSSTKPPPAARASQQHRIRPAVATALACADACGGAAASSAPALAQAGYAIPLAELRRGGCAHHFPPGRIVHLCDRDETGGGSARARDSSAPGASEPGVSLRLFRAIGLMATPTAAAAELELAALKRPPFVSMCEPAHYSKILLAGSDMMIDHLPDRVLALLALAHEATRESEARQLEGEREGEREAAPT
jgi:hypothetical protein